MLIRITVAIVNLYSACWSIQGINTGLWCIERCMVFIFSKGSYRVCKLNDHFLLNPVMFVLSRINSHTSLGEICVLCKCQAHIKYLNSDMWWHIQFQWQNSVWSKIDYVLHWGNFLYFITFSVIFFSSGKFL